jgi:hypothetical protein
VKELYLYYRSVDAVGVPFAVRYDTKKKIDNKYKWTEDQEVYAGTTKHTSMHRRTSAVTL